jgi:hypothetical protein
VTILTGAKNLPFNIKEKRDESGTKPEDIEDNRVKIETGVNNHLQTERSEK